MTKGEIFWASNKENNPHPIVFMERIDISRFKACILSTKETNGNILMSEEHFLSHDNQNNPYSIIFNNTHLITGDSFIKMNFWLRGDIAQGKLTREGIEFIEKHITEKPVLCPAPIWIYRQE
ncbi:hypothetical protein LUD75_08490 [Epilithonimonas sp. JDS]|uniref:hypothetical protein n=1 Tax=Epilithonimonas sp. JDS TaxID=2902797 RepID=UPI001E44136A|nr:hypothetical protein [Epilithonimonas sp. JDS]MCD9854740.1 hypothetical protein [Epilithonimonas sp. JDS]